MTDSEIIIGLCAFIIGLVFGGLIVSEILLKLAKEILKDLDE